MLSSSSVAATVVAVALVVVLLWRLLRQRPSPLGREVEEWSPQATPRRFASP